MDHASRVLTETRLIRQELGFSGAYMAVKYLRSHINAHPESITGRTCLALLCLAKSNRFESKKQALFLYREAFEALVAMVKAGCAPGPGRILLALCDVLMAGRGRRIRALSQALGRLPVAVPPAESPGPEDTDVATIHFQTVMHRLNAPDTGQFVWKGRSLIFTGPKDTSIVFKFAVSETNSLELAKEARWLARLSQDVTPQKKNGSLPAPLVYNGRLLFRIQGIPHRRIKGQVGLLNFPAIIFTAPRDYYAYPNTVRAALSLPKDRITSIFCRGAQTYGHLMSKGLVHTAVIPLFHNRVQQDRRNDNGAYLWEHGGRLDQWLASCRHPNFAASGIRDLEHLTHLDDSRRMHHYIGEHLLGFILVMGSYFRNKAPHRRGQTPEGTPHDARSQFDPAFFKALLRATLFSYCRGLTGNIPRALHELSLDGLVAELIEKMGRDEHMEEVLRIRDQEGMDKQGFRQFLEDRGVNNLAAFKRGEADIILMTGPHLGAFNQPISVPGLIEFLFRFAGLCMSDLYLTQNRLNPKENSGISKAFN